MLDNKYNLSIWQGSTFALTIRLTDANNVPKNITGYSARMQIRPSYNSSTITESLTTANGEITIPNGTDGAVQIQLDAARTAAIPVNLDILSNVRLSDGTVSKLPKQTYVYDLELINGTDVTKIVYGDAIVYGEVTR